MTFFLLMLFLTDLESIVNYYLHEHTIEDLHVFRTH
jgi:hypothetical protein